MKQYQINEAYDALNQLMQSEMRMEDACRICELREKLEPYYKAELEREHELVDVCGGTIAANGMITFSEEEMAQKFKAEISKLLGAEICMEVDRVKLSEDFYSEQKITPTRMMALRELIYLG